MFSIDPQANRKICSHAVTLPQIYDHFRAIKRFSVGVNLRIISALRGNSGGVLGNFPSANEITERKLKFSGAWRLIEPRRRSREDSQMCGIIQTNFSVHRIAFVTLKAAENGINNERMIYGFVRGTLLVNERLLNREREILTSLLGVFSVIKTMTAICSLACFSSLLAFKVRVIDSTHPFNNQLCIQPFFGGSIIYVLLFSSDNESTRTRGSDRRVSVFVFGITWPWSVISLSVEKALRMLTTHSVSGVDNNISH